MTKEKKVTAHSPIGASSAYRWMVCPGSVKLSEGILSIAGPDAQKGTEAHGYLEGLLRGTISESVIPEEDGMREAVVYAFDAIRTQIAEAEK